MTPTADFAPQLVIRLLPFCLCATVASAFVYGSRGGGAYGDGQGGYGAVYGSGGGGGHYAGWDEDGPYRPPTYRRPVYRPVPGPLYGYNKHRPIYGGGGDNNYYYSAPAPKPPTPCPPAGKPSTVVPTSSMAPPPTQQSTQTTTQTTTTAQTAPETTTTPTAQTFPVTQTTAQTPPERTTTIIATTSAGGGTSTGAGTAGGGASRSSPTRAGTPRGSPIPGGTVSPSASTDSPGGGGNKNLVVRPQFGTEQTCMSTSGLNGPIVSKMNKPLFNGTFSVFVSNTNGTCRWQLNAQSDSRSMLAAVSRELFNGRDDVTESCLPGNISLLKDPVCMDKCVNIFYPKTGKTLTCPIEHQCADCTIDNVQLSGAAFRFLEPDAAIGTGTGARVTFFECIF
ncbi:hypothetical protein niasHT_025653 [Heterodera trifolii]|uniref:Uncharacterized protein n=1 Tax=Heterodera trifolii TaxID=157864 RepID=A0ABD2KHR6_9BILA